MNPRISGLFVALFVLTACGSDPARSRVISAPIARASASQSAQHGRVVIYTDPVYNQDGRRLKFWAYGEPFAQMVGGSYLVHAAGICVLLAGPRAQVKGVEESDYVPNEEMGMIVANYDGTRVDEVGAHRFGPADPSPGCTEFPREVRLKRECTGRQPERNFYIKRIACLKAE